MNIIQKQPNPSGAHPPIQTWSDSLPPDGFYRVAHGVELSHGGFGTLIAEDGIVTGFTPDIAAWEQWQADNPTPEPQPTTEEKLIALEQTTYLFQQATLAYLEGME